MTKHERKPVSNLNEISTYLHCGRCGAEFMSKNNPATVGQSLATWARLAVGWTPAGLQVWCERHQCNVVHIDFEGVRHPANVTSRADA